MYKSSVYHRNNIFKICPALCFNGTETIEFNDQNLSLQTLEISRFGS